MTWRPVMSCSHGLLDILLVNVFCRTACCKEGRDKKKMKVYKCEDIWVCRKMRDVSRGHQFGLIDFSEFSHKLM